MSDRDMKPGPNKQTVQVLITLPLHSVNRSPMASRSMRALASIIWFLNQFFNIRLGSLNERSARLKVCTYTRQYNIDTD
jgi:hypothetical protein